MAKEIQTKSFGYDVFDLIKFALDKRRILIVLTLTAFVLSIVISLMIKNRYKSTVILFPSATVSISKSLVETGTTSSNEKDVLTYGDDEDAERLLQILRSDQLADHIIEKFDLINYYEIDKSPNKYPITKLKSILNSNIKFRRTQYNSIEIEVFDRNPQLAADIANEIAYYSDTIIYRVGNKRAKEAYKVVLNEYDFTQKQIMSITDSLDKIRSYGITDYVSQSRELYAAYGKAILKRDNAAIKIFEKELKIMQKYGGPYYEYTQRIGWEISRLSSLKAKLAATKANLDPSISYVFIVDKAVKAEKKASPKRSLIVLFSTFSAFAFSLLTLILLDKFKTRI
jgi:uncharacterized protein involved in exopolysaccharide biosynthesis